MAASVMLLAACGSVDDPGAMSPSAGASTPASTSASPTVPPSPLPVPSGADFDEPSPGAGVPVWDDESRAAAIAAGEAIMRAFARPDLPEGDWWAGLSPLLSSTAQDVYVSVDPANIPVTTVTGPGESVEETTPYLARIEVPTDAGTYTVLLSREDAAASWLGERITPPDAP